MSARSDLKSKPTDCPIIITTMEQSQITGAGKSTPILHQVAGKHQMLPLVVIQTQNPKLNTTSTNSMLNMPSLQIQPLNNQMVLGKTPIMLQKTTNLPKNGVTYVTMLKPVSKPPDNIRTAACIPITAISQLKTDSKLQVINNQKIMITPMPSVTTNRLPVTMTTNTVQPKFSFMPIMQSNNLGKVISLKLTDAAQLKTDDKLVDLSRNDLTITAVPDKKLVNDDKLDGKEEASYQLSIVEDAANPIELPCLLEEPCKSRISNIQGVSILKKAFNFQTERVSSKPKTDLKPVISSIPKISSSLANKTIVTVSDPNTKEVQIKTYESVNPLPPSSVAPPAPPPPPPPTTTKRSRKATLGIREDYHEIELEMPVKKKDKTLDDDKNIDMEVDMITSSKPSVANFLFNSLLDDDIRKMLDWNMGIGKLDGTDLRFLINEFGLLEYLTDDEYAKMSKDKKKEENAAKKRAKQKHREQMQEEMRCVVCGCFGMANEFISPRFCSTDCQAEGEKKGVNIQNQSTMNFRKRTFPITRTPTPIQIPTPSSTPPASTASTPVNCGAPTAINSTPIMLKRRRMDIGELKEPSSDDDASVRTDTSNEKHCPWQCRTKGFSWSKYLAHINAVGAPVKLFKDPFPYNRNGFRQGMKLEGIDPLHPSIFCVMTVSQVQGYRLLLHFDGYPKTYDFWVNADSMDIFPAGFCEKHDHVLFPPPNFPNFNWTAYLKHTKSTAAPKHLFTNRTGSVIFPTAFRVGMKLEAVDRKNSSLVCVATAKDLLDSRILVHFDSWDDIYDYWADPSSHYVHPVGWCEKNGHSLTPPNDYPDPKNFTWEKYLKETNSTAAPVRAFKQRPPSGFKKGMRLECVDKRVPQLIRVSTVVDVKDHQLRIAFDGWPDRYSYYVDDDSPDIHPVGWCHKTGHPLEPPLTPDDVYDFLECATIGCKGVGNVKGPLYIAHSTTKLCPYAEENIDADRTFPDRLLSPYHELEEAVPKICDPKRKKSIQKKKYETNSSKTEWLDDIDPQEESKALKMVSPSPPSSIKKEHDEDNIEEAIMRTKYAKHFRRFVRSDVDPRNWSVKRVSDYVRTLPFARHKADSFTKHVIDGESFLMLNQDDLVEVLNFKLGPAIALYNCIVLLRSNITQCS